MFRSLRVSCLLLNLVLFMPLAKAQSATWDPLPGTGSDIEQLQWFHAAHLLTGVRCVAKSLAMASSQRSLSARALRCMT